MHGRRPQPHRPGRHPAGKRTREKYGYATDEHGREACEFVEKHKKRPWFLHLAFNAVHTPMQATDDRLAKFADVADKQRRTYCAMMLATDEAVGKLRD